MAVVPKLDTDKEPYCLWKPLDDGRGMWGRDAFCRDDGCGVHVGVLYLASGLCVLDQFNAGSNCGKGRNFLHSFCWTSCLFRTVEAWQFILSLSDSSSLLKSRQACFCSTASTGAARRLLQIESIPAHLSVPGCFGIFSLVLKKSYREF